MNGETSNDLNWLAFQYVIDELDDFQRARFEILLADDLTACMAVERAVELLAATHAAESERKLVELACSDRQSRKRQRRSRMLAGIGLALVVFLAVGLFRANRGGWQQRPSDDLAGIDSRGTPELAITWFEIDGDLDIPDVDESISIQSAPASTELASGDEGTETLAAPDWLISALAAKAQRAVPADRSNSAFDEG